MTFRPHQLRHLDIHKRNRWLKDVLTRAGFARVMFGSADISWENWLLPAALAHRHVHLQPQKADQAAEEDISWPREVRPSSGGQQSMEPGVPAVQRQGDQTARPTYVATGLIYPTYYWS